MTEGKRLSRLKSDIKRMQVQLINRAKKNGLCENFGQDKVHRLQNKYSDMSYHSGHTGLIIAFSNWCASFSLNDITGNDGIVYHRYM
jgi:hypothetical protein